MRTCPQCKADCRDDVSRCSKCGARLGAVPPVEAPVRPPASLGRSDASRGLLVSDVMTAPVRTIEARASAREAAALMRGGHVQHLVVIDARRRAIGVLSDRDLRAAQPSLLLVRDQAQRENALSLLKVEDVMSHDHDPQFIHRGDSVTSALRRMRKHKIGSLPVIDESGAPIGILTGFDVLSLALRLLGEHEA